MRRLMTWWMLRNELCDYCEDGVAVIVVTGDGYGGSRRSFYGCSEHIHSARYWAKACDNCKEYMNGV